MSTALGKGEGWLTPPGLPLAVPLCAVRLANQPRALVGLLVEVHCEIAWAVSSRPRYISEGVVDPPLTMVKMLSTFWTPCESITTLPKSHQHSTPNPNDQIIQE